MDEKKSMHLLQPAERWEDALPIGNGTTAALVYGNICRETLLINHEALWIRSPKKDAPSIAENLPELREMLAADEWKFSDYFLDVMLKEKGYTSKETDPYHPAFDMLLVTNPKCPFTNYARLLDFETGEAIVRWDERKAHYERRCFVSNVDNMLVLEYAVKESSIECECFLQPHNIEEQNLHFPRTHLQPNDIPIRFETNAKQDNTAVWLSIVGSYTNNLGDLPFGGLVRIVPTGGQIKLAGTHANIQDAKKIMVYIKLFAHQDPAQALAQIETELRKAPAEYSEMFQAHAQINKGYFNRVTLDLDCAGDRAKSNEVLLLEGYKDQVSAALVERMFHYGRYLLISSSRPGGWPASLQGKWNGEYRPAWSSDYHNDENVQMCYWAALPGHLPELTLPYFDFYEAALPDYRKHAKAVYGCRGIFIPIAQAIKGEAPLYHGVWLNWTAGAGWMAQLFYDYWLFTGDKIFLRDRAIPFLREVAWFYEDFLILDAQGKYMFSPSLSPENTPNIPNGSIITINATMDVAVAKEVLTNLCEGCEVLGIEAENVKKWRAIIEKLPAYEINADGAIKEWIHPRLPDNYHHRHLAHLYPVFPGFEIHEENNPQIFKACKVAAEKRQVIGQTSQSGWSLIHMANVYARLHKGDQAFTCISNMIRGCVGTNLFTYHNDWRHQGLSLWWEFKDRIFQIDANLGLVAVVLDMLVYSTPSMVYILPALPSAWPKGSIEGVSTRCGAQVDVKWDMPSASIHLTVTPSRDLPLAIKLPKKAKNMKITPPSVQVNLRESDRGICELKAVPGQPISLEINF